jgi:hypothetical protein
MDLPHADDARIDDRKLSDYLLSATHPVGRHKKRFFESIGFSSQRPDDLGAAIRAVARDGAVRNEHASLFGRTYIVDGWLPAPVGPYLCEPCGSLGRGRRFRSS